MIDFKFPGGSHSGRCKPCLNEVQRERYGQNPEAGRERQRQWYAANTGRALAVGRRHYEENRGYYAEKSTAWVKANPEANRARRARYRARKAAAPGGGVSLAEWIALRDSYGCCLKCLRTDVPLEPDHVVPLVHGGRDHIDNIQPLCRSCNSSKRAKGTDYRIYHPDDF
ncbi:HNH endonuclease [Streptomyces sp. ADI96-15]|uniref:HNH endonuclease n=1 Tax=Streptomyces sp. ADI96-15 TaxID=1522761 RepID=UPI0013DE282F|nr:HNH endonuclease signature motif containing protein [Streptomyces sp. ADI96-15]